MKWEEEGKVKMGIGNQGWGSLGFSMNFSLK